MWHFALFVVFFCFNAIQFVVYFFTVPPTFFPFLLNEWIFMFLNIFTFFQPRLGPKPFSSNAADVTFDKVFAVPVAPGSQENLSNTKSETPVTHETDSTSPSATKPDLIVEIEIKSK